MDPTFAGHMRRYLATLGADHAVLGDGTCRCGDPLEDGSLADHVLDVLTAAFAEPELAPHVVHVAGAIEHHKPYNRIDEESGDQVKVKGSSHVGPLDCPDCTRGLVSRGHDLICIQLDRALELRGCHPGCIVACGREG